MLEYTTPVSVDFFGTYPGKKPGDTFESMYEGRVYIVTIVGKASIKSNGTILRDAHIKLVEGPVTREFTPFEARHPNWRKYTKQSHKKY
ncbi:hypothetical protein Xoosp13_6 [Xanthomonas phage Xoo-sp13]|nr:hypothetical protein Xoosp13_6 [Xanthomonas phage Xoo-sp13]